MAKNRFKLSAKVSSNSPLAIKPVLERLVGATGSIKSTPDGFEVEASLEGGTAKDLNRALLSEMRRVEKRTRLRAEWSSENTVERFFDYVPKGTRKIK
jgi:hypothetical protein